MGRALTERLKQGSPLPDPVQEAAANLLLAARWLDDRIAQLLEPLGLSHAQYNVLRILRGARREGHPRGEIAARLIVRAPDVTRLVDRLVASGLATRGRGQAGDRRQSVARITAKGLALLERADQVLDSVYAELKARLGTPRCAVLSQLCEVVWSGSES